jgi:Sulfotransferase family
MASTVSAPIMVQTQSTAQVAASRDCTSPPSPWRGPLFVIGMWRSGTSLLYALLNKHPQIGLMYEGDLPLLRSLFWIRGATANWLRRWEFWNGAPRRHTLNANGMARDVSRWEDATEQVHLEYARQKRALIWGDKSPNYYDSLTYLARHFPEARFVVIWRDPAATCRSVIRAGKEHSWFGRRGMPLRALIGQGVLRAECDRLVRSGGRIHELHYEALVQDTAATMKGICEFLGIPFVPEVASLVGADRSAIYQGEHHSLVKGERIISSTERLEIMSSDLKKKIERYEALWRAESGGKWPVISLPQNGDPGRPSVRERAFDRIRYRYFRAFDSLVVFVYCFAPLWFLKRLRAFKHRDEAAITQSRQRTNVI